MNLICLPGLIASNYCLEYTTQVVYSLIFGITSGTFLSLMSVVLIDLIGLKNFVQGFGIQLLVMGIGRTVGPPMIGKFKINKQ